MTYRYTYPTLCAGNAFYVEADIGIKQSITTWHFGVNDILPQGKQDLYCGVLHEIGHALGLNHSIDLGVNGNLELMHWSQLPGQSGGTPAAGRKTLSSAGGNSSAGAFVDIISYSRGLNPSACTDLNPLTTRLISSPSINPASPIVVCTGSSISLTSSAVNSSTVGNLIANSGVQELQLNLSQ